MEYQILAQPTYSALEVTLHPGDSIVAEAGAMAWMSDNIKTTTSTRGGIFSGLKRAVLGGESFFQNTYTAEDGPGLVGLVPGCPGDIAVQQLNNGELMMERGAYLASNEGVTVDSKWQGFGGLFKEGLFALRVTGTGLVFFCSYGRIEEIQVHGDYLVDNGYAVAWEPTLEYRVSRARKIRSFLFSDQLLMRFTGHGRLWVQSRTPQTLANWVFPFRPAQSSG
jgi:uncharacterized protein (TIGR00266 family)